VKSLITLAILAALYLVEYANTSISPIESDNHSISDDVDITMMVNDAYASVIFTSHIEEIYYNQKFKIIKVYYG
jgi:hypothetical protein